MISLHKIKNALALVIVSALLYGCASHQETLPPPPSEIKTFRYGGGVVCQEKKGQPIFQLGIECLCNQYPSHAVSQRSKKPGYTSECIDPQVWAAEDRQIKQAEQRAREEEARLKREREIQAERNQQEIERYKKTAEGQRVVRNCLSERKRYEGIVNSCAAAYDRKSCVTTRFKIDLRILSACISLGYPVEPLF